MANLGSNADAMPGAGLTMDGYSAAVFAARSLLVSRLDLRMILSHIVPSFSCKYCLWI